MTTVLQPIGAGDLFEYPIPSTERLHQHFFMPWHYRRWMASDFRNSADLDVRAVAIDLFCAAQDQAPVGTLPADEMLLARLVDLTLDHWSLSRDRMERFVRPDPLPMDVIDFAEKKNAV